MGIYEKKFAQEKSLKKRLKFVSIIVVLVFVVLIGRLYYMQVAKAEDFVNVSENNKVRLVSIPARRGMIFDKNMVTLASSKPAINISIIQDEVADDDKLANNLSALLGNEKITKKSILADMKNEYKSYAPLLITSMPYPEGMVVAQIIAERKDDFQGVEISEEPTRSYPKGSVLGQVLGSVGLINKNEYNKLKDDDYKVTDVLGKTGLEKQYENFIVNDKNIGLRGSRGIEQVEVDAKFKPVRTISKMDPIPGDSLVLTIDSKVQRAMEESLSGVVKNISQSNSKCKGGAGVLIDVKTGGVIAMANYPLMDPNDFVAGLSKEDVKYYFDEKKRPMINRAISSGYAPGSTFKLVSASAIIHSGIDPTVTVNCSRENWVKPLAKCPHEHGTVNLYSATAKSCNTYFQIMANKAGGDKLINMGNLYGFGEKTGIDLPGEESGFLPTEEWKKDQFQGGEGEWHNYDTYYMSMGQGYNVDTILQLANYTATVANGGTRMAPYIVDEIVSPTGVTLHKFIPKAVANTELTSAETLILKKAMGAVTAPGGTAYPLFKDFPKDIKVGAKSGTAQTGQKGDNKNSDYHGLFIAFAPMDNPQVAFAGIVEYGRTGGGSAGVVARDTFRAYFGLEYDDDIGILEVNTEE